MPGNSGLEQNTATLPMNGINKWLLITQGDTCQGAVCTDDGPWCLSILRGWPTVANIWHPHLTEIAYRTAICTNRQKTATVHFITTIAYQSRLSAEHISACPLGNTSAGSASASRNFPDVHQLSCNPQREKKIRRTQTGGKIKAKLNLCRLSVNLPHKPVQITW